MNTILQIAEILFLTEIMKAIIILSYNLTLKRQLTGMWIFSMFFLNLFLLVIGSKFPKFFFVIFMSVANAGQFFFPYTKTYIFKKPTAEEIKDSYIIKGTLKYKLGFYAFVLGGLIGLGLFYLQTHRIITI